MKVYYINSYLLCLLMQFISLDITIKTESLFSFEGEFLNGEPMGIPMMISTYNDGAIVLYEYDVQTLKKFDKDGNFLKTLTKRGRGPGEFLDIDHIFIDRDDRLFVVDHIQLKMTIINSDLQKTDYPIFENRPRIRSFHQTDESKYIVGFINYSGFGIPSGVELFYLIDTDIELLAQGFVTPNDLHQVVPGSVPEVAMRGSTRLTENSVLTLNDDLLVVPALYNGKMLLYSKKSDYSEHEIVKISGDYGPPYEELQEPRQMSQELYEVEGFTMVNNPSGRKFFLHFNRSLGLFKHSTGHIIHFAQIHEGNEAVLVAEILDDRGLEVLHVQKIERLGNLNVVDNSTGYRKYSRIDFVIHHLDHLNRLFVSRFGENDLPELHVIELDIKF